jgi:GNAT superfamily N-acetyltransferase
MLEGRRDLSVLWDIRVAPDARGKSIGSALFQRVEAWAQARGCRQLKIETQNIIVRACELYARPGLRVVRTKRVRAPNGPPCRVP